MLGRPLTLVRERLVSGFCKRVLGKGLHVKCLFSPRSEMNLSICVYMIPPLFLQYKFRWKNAWEPTFQCISVRKTGFFSRSFPRKQVKVIPDIEMPRKNNPHPEKFRERSDWRKRRTLIYRTIFMRGLATAQMVIQAKAAILPVEDPNWPYRIRIPVTSESLKFLAQLEG